MDTYNKLSASYDRLYKNNIQNFQDRLSDIWKGDSEFVDFYPSLGIKRKQTCDLLFYGQAMNGWKVSFDIFDYIDEVKINLSILASNSYFDKLSHTPLDWVNVKWSNSTFNAITADEDAKLFYTDDNNNYRTYRSFFWRVIYKFTCDFYGLDRNSWDWAKQAVWSNLYKIAEDGANPNDFLREQQVVTSAELIRQEIEELRPKYCIILTNYEWWRPFQKLIKTTAVPFDKSLTEIVSLEQYYDTKLIITTRPWLGSGENHVRQILKLINS